MKEALAKYRLEDAKEKLDSSKILFESGKYKDSISRSYYAMFSGARALLATKGLDSPKHSGIISLFNLHFVKEGLIDKLMGRRLASAKDVREKSDYGDFTIVSKEEAQTQLEYATEFVKEIEKALSDKI